MKKAFIQIALVLSILLLGAGCNDLKELASDYLEIPLQMKGPDGTMTLTAVYDAHPSDVPGCSGVICHTSGKDVYTSIWLSFYFSDSTLPGKDLILERMNFGAALSSNSNEYTHSFTGKMILKEQTDKKVVIFMQDVHFQIAHGEYVLNGYLTAKKAQ